MRARLTWMMRQAGKQADGSSIPAGSAAPAAAGGATAAGMGGSGGPLGKADVEAIYEHVARNSANESNRMAAADKLAKLRGFIREGEQIRAPDPAFLCWFLGRCETDGADPVVVAQNASNVA